jgi:PEGA domain
MRRLWPAVLLVVGLLSPRAAAQSGEELERAKASFQAGATAYAAGEYLAAIQAFDAAYALTPVPAIAFSLAQAERRQYFVAHERDHLDRAITLFRRYVAEVPAGGRRADALDALSQLEPLAAARTSERAATGAEATRSTRLMITAEAPGARLSLDGGPAAPSPLIREVEPGKHRIAISAEGFFPDERELTAVPGELVPAVVTLRERPSTLVVSTPADAEIYVDGAFASHGGRGLTLALPSGAHRLTVAENGHRVSSHRLELERGKSQTVHVVLERTLQRRASRLLFVAGGVALGAGIAFGALTLAAEKNAKDFLGKRERGSVTSDELARYGEDARHRDRYLAATVGSLAASAGCFLTGLFLHQFDQPPAEQLYRDATVPASGARSPGQSVWSRWQVVPVAARGSFFALVRAGF